MTTFMLVHENRPPYSMKRVRNERNRCSERAIASDVSHVSRHIERVALRLIGADIVGITTSFLCRGAVVDSGEGAVVLVPRPLAVRGHAVDHSRPAGRSEVQ